MKKLLKRLSAIFCMALTACLCFALASCGGTTAKTSNIFLSPSQLSYTNMRPAYNYYLTTFTHEELTLNDDGTYCMIVSSSTFSALILSEDTNDCNGNERTNYITKYYGTYTSVANDLDEDLIDISLSAPTRIVKSNDQQYFLDTDSWTEAMGLAVREGKIDGNGNMVVDPSTPAKTAEEYLASEAFAAMTVQGNIKTASMDYVDLSK